ncbi:transposase-like protein [Tsukamurella ocularis]|uniref:IS256 family transposase n=1 Tax=Tsukamurella ocularis TaxID=1970234 RepID=UPI002168F021|nr:IS256 family transposase [Tsukamurella ocularis]MCS3790038.1 transposase-like protein [Tsukamurella ocularis]
MSENSEPTSSAENRPAPVVPDLQALAQQLVASASDQGLDLTGENGMLTALTKQVLQSALDAEMAAHLGYDKGDPVGRNRGNSRNGSTPKTITTDVGKVTIDVPRDREASFEPQVVRKHQRRLAGFDEAVISLYAKGMTTGDIARHLEDVYDTDVSRSLVSAVTEQVVDDMRSWQSRPLDPVYPVILIDAIVLKIREGQVANRPVYVAMGIDCNGFRDVLGLWIGPSGGEGAKQWMNMLTDLKNRGIVDACIVCCDGLKGLPSAIEATWPHAIVQTCVVHLVRNSLRYASKKHWSEISRDLKRIYHSATVEAAEAELELFADKWAEKYPAMVAMWRRSWPEFIPFLDFPIAIRKLIYTTNGIESLNARFRAATRRRGHFPDEQSALKVLYLACLERRHNRPNPSGQIAGWKSILNTLAITFGDRLEVN